MNDAKLVNEKTSTLALLYNFMRSHFAFKQFIFYLKRIRSKPFAEIHVFNFP